MTKIIMKCPECSSTLMGKSGKVWSGRTRVQRWRCEKCGRTTVKPKED